MCLAALREQVPRQTISRHRLAVRYESVHESTATVRHDRRHHARVARSIHRRNSHASWLGVTPRSALSYSLVPFRRG